MNWLVMLAYCVYPLIDSPDGCFQTHYHKHTHQVKITAMK